ncbi:sulfatase [Persicitalea jodogahamensis]|nr:sulfatase [Persicitalea jodogahamensis]
MRKTSFFLLLSFALQSLGAQPTKKPSAIRPNVLFIAVDDLKPLLSAYGESRMKTPNIDRLARMGTVFLNNYCQQAVCAPTRASLLTGQRPDYTQVWDLETLMRDKNPDILTLPQYFRQNGYTTTGLGKVFDSRSVDKMLDEPSWSVPFDKLEEADYAAGYGRPKANYYQGPETLKLLEEIRTKAGKMGLKGEKLKDYLNKNRGPAVESAEVPDDAYQDGAVAKKAVATIARLAKDGQPFFYAAGFVRPHLPFVAPRKYWDLYDREEINTAAYQQFATDSPQFAYQASGELVNAYLLPNGDRYPTGYAPKPTEMQKELIHGYYAAVSYMDAQVGKLLDALDEQGLTKNTIIVLWGDHGWHLGDHGIWCKHTNFEQATRAPLIIAAPGLTGGQKAEGLTEFVDVFPTLTDLAGLKTPEKLAGKSLVPMMKNPNATVKRFAQSQYPRSTKEYGKLMGYAIRTPRYRYVAWFAEDYDKNKVLPNVRPIAEELYDYEDDPNEEINFAAHSDHQDALKEHQVLLTEFLGSQPQAR